MIFRVGSLMAALLLLIGLSIAPAAQARPWHGGGHPHPGRHYGYYRRGNAVGPAIVGGLIGLGVGAAIASGGGYYGAAPGYYGPAPGYYASPPPPVYYGY